MLAFALSLLIRAIAIAFLLDWRETSADGLFVRGGLQGDAGGWRDAEKLCPIAELPLAVLEAIEIGLMPQAFDCSLMMRSNAGAAINIRNYSG